VEFLLKYSIILFLSIAAYHHLRFIWIIFEIFLKKARIELLKWERAILSLEMAKLEAFHQKEIFRSGQQIR